MHPLCYYSKSMKNWRGKALGGSIGSIFGPLGALVGATAGHFLVDRKKVPPADQAMRLIAITAGALYETAAVGGRYTSAADTTLRRILVEISRETRAPVGPHELDYFIGSAGQLGNAILRLAHEVQPVPPLARAALSWLWRVAAADGEPAPQSLDRIRHFAAAARIPPGEAAFVEAVYCRAAAAPDAPARQQACALLGVPYAADSETLKRAYRAQSLKYHPDRHAALDPDIRALTAEKFTQVKNAYDLLTGAVSSLVDGTVVSADGALVPAAPGQTVYCFLCRARATLPAADGLSAARCPDCHALLVLDRRTAASFT